MGEVVNICATVERLIDALKWFDETQRFRVGLVFECHPSASDTKGGSDLVIGDEHGAEMARAEVSDIVSETQDSNVKEASDLGRLGCSEAVPRDGVARFLVTSSQFAQYLIRPKRRWTGKHYRYEQWPVAGVTHTVLLEIFSSNRTSQ